MKALTLKRDVTQKECPWLDADLPKGTQVWIYDGPTYGVVTSNGIAVTAKVDETPFFEIPQNAV
jgi:hypothetical protein